MHDIHYLGLSSLVSLRSHIPDLSLVAVALSSVVRQLRIAYLVFLIFPLLLIVSVREISIVNFDSTFSFIFSFIFFNIISSYILFSLSMFVSLSFVCSPPFLLFIFPFCFPLSLLFSFVPTSSSLSSASFPFPIFLFLRYLSFVPLPFSSFFFSLFSTPPCCFFFSSLGYSYSPPPPFSAVSTPSLIVFLFLFSFSTPLLLLPFLLLLLFSFSSCSLFCFSPLRLLLFLLLLLLRRLLLPGFFLSYCFPPLLAVSFFPSPFLFLPLLSPVFSYSFSPFSLVLLLSFLLVFPLSFVVYSFAYYSLVAFLRSVVSFSFLFFQLFRLYSSAVSFLFCSPYCIPPRFFFFHVRFVGSFPILSPPPPLLRSLRGFLCSSYPSSCACGSVFVSFLSSAPHRLLCFLSV